MCEGIFHAACIKRARMSGVKGCPVCRLHLGDPNHEPLQLALCMSASLDTAREEDAAREEAAARETALRTVAVAAVSVALDLPGEAGQEAVSAPSVRDSRPTGVQALAPGITPVNLLEDCALCGLMVEGDEGALSC